MQTNRMRLGWSLNIAAVISAWVFGVAWRSGQGLTYVSCPLVTDLYQRLLRFHRSNIFGDFHGAEFGAAHAAEVGAFESVLGKCFIVHSAGSFRIERQAELLVPV